MSVKNLSENDFNAFIAEGTALVDFWATWCGPCRMQSPVVEQFAAAHPEVKVGKVNVDEQQALAMRFQVMSIPTLIVFKNGKIVNTQVGLAPIERLETMTR